MCVLLQIISIICIRNQEARHGHISGGAGVYRGPVLHGQGTARWPGGEDHHGMELQELAADGTITQEDAARLRAELDDIPGF